MESVSIGIIGYGYWGPNIVRNFFSAAGAKVEAVCDRDARALEKVNKTYPGIKTTLDLNDVLTSPSIDAVAIVTPVFSHYELAKKALENGKHIFVEKPFTAKASEAEELIELAEKKKLRIMVDHTFIFTGAVKKIKELISENALGNIYYFDSTRVNLGLFQHDVNVIWDLAPHDLSIMDYLIREKPVAVSATGIGHFERGRENIAYITVYFDGRLIAHFNVNWLSPVKVRTILIGGAKKMVVWDDIEADEKLKVYDRGVTFDDKEGMYRALVEYRAGDMWSPKLDRREALSAEAEYFVDCVLNDKTPVNDGRAGYRVVKMIEAANQSLKHKGRPVEL